MTKRIGVALLAAMLVFDGSAAISSAGASPLQIATRIRPAGEAGDLGARRRTRHHHRDAHRPIDRPSYYDRPTYYAPAPFFPFLGFGYGPWW
jgi:hypothetical protein